jgi:hypothetical protein
MPRPLSRCRQIAEGLSPCGCPDGPVERAAEVVHDLAAAALRHDQVPCVRALTENDDRYMVGTRIANLEQGSWVAAVHDGQHCRASSKAIQISWRDFTRRTEPNVVKR